MAYTEDKLINELDAEVAAKFADLVPLWDATPSGSNNTVYKTLGAVAALLTGSTGAVDTVSTTDATDTTINTVAIPTDSVVTIECRAESIRTAGAGSAADRASYIISISAKNDSGTVTIGTPSTQLKTRDVITWDLTFLVSGTDVLVQVRGAAATDVDHQCRTTVTTLSI